MDLDIQCLASSLRT